ncbi:hypothetical protein [Streptomyces cylindrosporus]|uniref:Uncharacterized protein n=1 Tax=Streptomyces cylindrosporus TaxID=2927583 RepID=A0ABS9YPT9_9ACTN|nr:hypothetical protein [Streptomyces cylindrosporus]MCI3279150.1 hypothetical protein [Streptomyces cylindrosporus]
MSHSDPADDLKSAYRRLEEAIGDVARLEGAQGVMLEWIVVTAHQRYDEDGDPKVQIGQWLPDGMDVPYHRVMGLLDYALTMRRGEILQD